MSLSKSAPRKLPKAEVIALTMEYQIKFHSTLAKINKEISDLKQNYEKLHSGFWVSR